MTDAQTLTLLNVKSGVIVVAVTPTLDKGFEHLGII